MATQYGRGAFLSRLRHEIAAGRPLLMTGAGAGVCAKFIERGGADIIGVYNTGYFRMQGYGSLAGMLPMADANEMVYRMGEREILPQVKTTPVIAGLNGVDVTRDMQPHSQTKLTGSSPPAPSCSAAARMCRLSSRANSASPTSYVRRYCGDGSAHSARRA